MAVQLEPHLIHRNRRYAKERWFERLFAPIFEDILTLKLVNGFHLTHRTIIKVQQRDIWGRDKPPMVKIVEYDDTQIIWSRYLHARRALAEAYGMEPMYNTRNPLSPSAQATLDLYYGEEIQHGHIHGDDHYELEMRGLYDDWLQEHGREGEITPPWGPPGLPQ